MDWGSIIGGIGIGSVAASAITHYFSALESSKERVFNKKETVYLGLLDALYFSEIQSSTENAKKYGLWHNKAALVGSPKVVYYSQLVIDTAPNSIERKNALDNLKKQMRLDLGVDKRELK